MPTGRLNKGALYIVNYLCIEQNHRNGPDARTPATHDAAVHPRPLAALLGLQKLQVQGVLPDAAVTRQAYCQAQEQPQICRLQEQSLPADRAPAYQSVGAAVIVECSECGQEVAEGSP